MIGRADFWLAFGAATALHVGAAAYLGSPETGGGSGSGGAQSVSVLPSTPALSALVEEWRRAPEAETEGPTLVNTSAAEPLPNAPARGDATGRAHRPQAPAAPLAPERAPRIAALAPSLETLGETGSAARLSDARPEPASPALATPSVLKPPLAPSDPPALRTAPPPPAALALAARPSPRPEQRPSIARRVATGEGGGVTRGRASTDAVAAPSASDRHRAQARWAAQIQQSIARHQVYPRGSRESGRVRVSMVILKTGALGEVSVAQSSGAARLDQAALNAVRRAAPFPPAPDALSDTWYQVGQWISFERR